MPLISVIIPVYNASATIKRCIDSIVSHNAEIEIICVDDGSKDDSLSVLQQFATNDKRIRIYHQENAGAGAARNVGISLACGDFIMFCDADDVYLERTIDYIVEDIHNYNADYIVFHRQTIQTNGNVCSWGQGTEVQDLCCTWEEYLNNYMNQRSHGMGVVTKVYKREIITSNNVQFGKFLFGEDLWFNLAYIINSNRFIEDYRAVYQQYQTPGSICLRRYDNYYDLNLECIESFERQYPNETQRIDKFVLNFKYGVLKWSCSRILMGIDFDSLKERRIQLRNLFVRDDIRSIAKRISGDNSYLKHDRYSCKDILKQRTISYAMRNYYYPQFKGIISRLIRRYSI